jgi:lipopolysaccharide transport system ATP-binding protein
MLLERGALVASGPTSEIIARYHASGVASPPPNTWIDMSGVNRSGSGSVRVKALRFSSKDARMHDLPYPGGALEVSLQLVSDTPRRLNSVSITLYDTHGTKLVNADTLLSGEVVDLQAGLNLVTISVDALYLNPGRYMLGFWVAHHPRTVFDFTDSALMLDVNETDDHEFGVQVEGGGLVPSRFRVVTGERVSA